jgi:SAM-dependent methyltransferase
MRSMNRDFDALVAEGEAVPVAGWDFSWFAGRATEGRPPWAYQKLLATQLGAAGAALDLQTGGGEVLAGALQANPAGTPRVTATEAWPPNVPLARAALAPWRGAVVACSETKLPFREAAFDLVSARHPVVTPWTEVRRVLARGGTFVSQQVGAGSVRELTEAMLGPYPIGHERSPVTARARAEAAGLEVVRLETASSAMTFADVGAVIAFLRKVIWIVPGFSVEAFRPQLRRLHERMEREGPFVATSERFLIQCRG